jgi:hypothetical protein
LLLVEIKAIGEIKTILVGQGWSEEPWKFRFLDSSITLPGWISEKIIKALKEWAEVFPQEPTFAYRNYNVPSMLVRVDFTVEDNNKIRIFEIEDSPVGLGILKVLSGTFDRIMEVPWIKEVVAVWPTKKRKKGGDDPLLWPVVTPDELNKQNIKLLAPRTNVLTQDLISKSIWPVMYRETKMYLTKLGWAEKLNKSVDLESLCNYTARQGFRGIVFKGDGARGERVLLWPTKSTTKEVNEWLGGISNFGVCKLKTIKEEIGKWGDIYIQPLWFPIKVKLNGDHYYGIYRLFFIHDGKRWMSAGGFLNIRKSLKIHGASDAIFVIVSP